MSSATEMQALVDSIQALLPGQNPYQTLANELHKLIYSSSPASFRPQIWLLTACLALILVASIVALASRFQRGPKEFWIYKYTSTTAGIFIVPNSSICFLLYNSCYLVLLFPYTYFGLVFSSSKEGNLNDLVLWKTVIFLPLWTGAFHVAWATALAGNLRQSPLLSTSGGPSIPAWAMNGFFLAMQGLVPITVVPLEVVSNLYWNRGFRHYRDTHSLLQTLSDKWDGTASVELPQDFYLLGMKLVGEMDKAMHWFKAGWTVWAVWGILLVVTIIPSTLLYCHTLRTQIKAIQRPVELIHAMDLAMGRSHDNAWHSQTLRRAFVNLLLTSISLCAVVSIYTGIAIWTSIDAVGMLRSPKLVWTSYLLALYPYVLFAGCTVVLLLIRSFASKTSNLYRVSGAPLTFKSLIPGRQGRKPSDSDDSFKAAWERKKSLQILAEQRIFQVSVTEAAPSFVVVDVDVHERTPTPVSPSRPIDPESLAPFSVPTLPQSAHLESSPRREHHVSFSWKKDNTPELYLPPESPFLVQV
ncbi:hypothetical protein T439DRAFT_378689 [Meredithblackwellia eburnea MCA 4105]